MDRIYFLLAIFRPISGDLAAGEARRGVPRVRPRPGRLAATAHGRPPQGELICMRALICMSLPWLPKGPPNPEPGLAHETNDVIQSQSQGQPEDAPELGHVPNSAPGQWFPSLFGCPYSPQ